MTEIKRYLVSGSEFEITQHADGDYVEFDDHAAILAAIQEQVRTLAAENSIQDFIISAVKDLVSESEGVAGWHLNGDIATWDKALPELNHSETPATDSVLREIREQAVNGFSEFCGDNSVFIKETCNYDSLADAACIYLARIREGEQS